MATTRGRKSAAHLSLVPFVPAPPAPGLEPPGGLDAEAAAVFRTVVGSRPEAFGQQHLDLLASYALHVVNGRRIAALIAQQTDVESWQYAKLLSMQEKQTRALMSMATKLRICPSSTRPDAARKPAPGSRKPWE